MPKDIKKLLLKADKLQMGKEMALAEEFIDIEENIQGSRDSIEEKLDSTIKGLEDLKEIKNVIENKETDVIRTELLHVITLKGDKGDDGKDYTLTNTDKKEIASMVKVPVVEKVTEIIKEPIYTENIIEKALYESAENIVSKINELPIDEDKQIDASHIKNLPEVVNRVGFGSMLKDAPKDGLIYARQNRQWVEVTPGGGGGTWGSITGTLSDQTDLQSALNAKQDSIITGTSAQYLKGDLSLGTFPTNVSTFTNDSGYITSSALSGYVPNTRTLTINGTTLDLSADRSWTISSGTASTGLTNASGTWTANLSTGVSGGQSVIGGTASGNNLTLSSTSHATKGKILFGTSAYNEVNNRLGINTTTPLHGLDVKSDTPYNRILGSSGAGLLIGSFSSSEGAIWDAAVTPSYTNYMFLCSGGYSLFNAAIDIQFRTNNTTKMNISNAGKVGIGIGNSSPTAFIHLTAGTATANTAPLKLTSGTNLTTAEAGAMEFTTDNLYFTITTGAARKNVTLDEGLTSGRVPFATTNGRLIDDADMTFATDTLTVTKLVGATSVKVGTVAGYISSDGSTGATGTFTTVDLKTVTVKDGIITSIV